MDVELNDRAHDRPVVPLSAYAQRAHPLVDSSLEQRAFVADHDSHHPEVRERYKEIYDLSPLGFATFSRLGNVLDLNLAFAALLGEPRERIRGRSFSAWLAKGQLRAFIRHLNAVFVTRQKQATELVLCDGNQQPRVIRVESRAFSSVAGAPTACHSVLIDLSRQRRVELSTEGTRPGAASFPSPPRWGDEVEEKYQLLFSSISEAVLLYEKDTRRIVDANEKALRMYGYTAEEFRQLCFDQLHFVPRAASTATAGHRSESVCLWHKTRDGVPFPVEVKTGSFRWRGRTVIFAFIQDRCQQQVAEGRITLAAQVFECANESIAVADAGYRIVMVNPAFTRTTGYASDEVQGKDLRYLLAEKTERCEEIEERTFFPSLAALDESGRLGRECVHRHKSGDLYHAWENYSAVRDDGGAAVYHVLVFSDISELKQQEKQSLHLAHHDVLTGLPNRLLFNARLEQSLQLAKRHRTHLAVLFLDLDRFKHINDTLGHDAGDLLLKEMAMRIRQCVREQDTVARLGGDEFVVLLSEINHEEEAAQLADKILRATQMPVMTESGEITTSASIGISVFPRDGNETPDLLKAADAAMYCAKERGRHSYEFFTRELTLRAERRAKLAAAIRDNLASGGFHLSYQPQFDLGTGKMVGVEALLRWQDACGMESAPENIIAIAEESSLILELDLWVLRTACEQACQWHRSGLPLLPVAINFSTSNLMRENFARKVAGVLSEFQLPSEWIQLEFAENILYPGSRAIEVLSSLKQLGISLAIDDFGKGYSSLSALRDLPVDRIKMDKSFIDGVPENKGDAGVAKALIAMAHELNFKIMAEGVERDAQWYFLQSIGCDEAQGFRFGEPSAAESIPTYLDKVMTLRSTSGIN